MDWLARDPQALKPLREGGACSFQPLRPRVSCSCCPRGVLGKPCQVEGEEVDVGAPRPGTLGGTHSQGKGLLTPQESMSLSTWIRNGKALDHRPQ